MDHTDIVDAEFEDVMPADAKALAATLRAGGVNERDLRDIMVGIRHPMFVPGGRYYRKPDLWDFLRRQVKYLPAALLVLFFVWDLASDGDAARWVGSVLFSW